MTIINNLDLGAHTTWNTPMSTRKGAVWGATTQELLVEGGQSIIFSKSGIIRKRTETIWISTNPPDSTKVLRVVRQLQELANNPNLQPVYIQWASGGGTVVIDPEDGWYTLESVTPDMEVSFDGIVPVQIVVSYLSPGLASKALAVSYIGGPASIGWGGPNSNWLAYPLNSSGTPFLVNRFGAEGYIPTSYQLPMSAITPQPFIDSGTIGDLFKDRVAVYDTINTSSNPVPTGGGYVNSNWIETLHPDHQFVGDCVITNGLLLLLCQAGTRGIALYFWNINTSQWLQLGRLDGFDNNNSGGIFWILQNITLGRISYQETSIALYFATSASNWLKIVLRVIAGANYVRCQATELSQTNKIFQLLQLTSTVVNPKVTYHDSAILDNSLSLEQNKVLPLSGTLNFGYSSCFANSSSLPCVFGWLYLDNTIQSNQGFAASNGIGLGDSMLSPIINQSKFFGFFIAPFSLPQNLQAEGESGSLGTGWSSVANANASGGFEAKALSGTTVGNADLFGVSFVPPAGAYDIWYRLRVTSSSGSTPEMTVGLWNDTTGVYVPGGSTTLAANQVPITYTGTGTNWIKVNPTSPLVPTSGSHIRFRAVTAGTLGTDWFVDEAVMVPINMLPSFNSLAGPRDIWQQFAFDRATRLISL